MTAPLVDVARLAELEANATEAPWDVDPAQERVSAGVRSPTGLVAIMYSGVGAGRDQENLNADFIAAVRNALPALLRELRSSRAAVEAARGEAREKALTEAERIAQRHSGQACLDKIRALRAPGGAS